MESGESCVKISGFSYQSDDTAVVFIQTETEGYRCVRRFVGGNGGNPSVPCIQQEWHAAAVKRHICFNSSHFPGQRISVSIPVIIKIIKIGLLCLPVDIQHFGGTVVPGIGKNSEFQEDGGNIPDGIHLLYQRKPKHFFYDGINVLFQMKGGLPGQRSDKQYWQSGFCKFQQLQRSRIGQKLLRIQQKCLISGTVGSQAPIGHVKAGKLQ